ncbi:ankyrin repeat domain-containing protein [Sphingomonas sp. IC-56]|uniref:ankyrin repeat domain-containing protein n=1 Tax=Sphingomonas sp. IC-56 TaxID=2898529 RepID=UPI001E5730E9|nr:ankyrin repeat domain-containing protein [Sphingomonas sp. IC-56]MCD2323514.1 ankyrin repeat domain-containing protein [Sphingomonas sp. IC-56]
MKFRAFRLAASAALMVAAMPAAAQQISESHEFLEAVRKADGTKVNQFLSNPTQRLINSKDRSTGEGAIHIVTKRRDQLYLRVVLQQDDVNKNLQDREGNTALLIAADQGWGEGVSILLKYGANPNTPNSAGQTPLIRAVLSHQEDVVRQLLAAKADPDRADYQTGMSAREYAKRESRYAAIAKLVADAPKAGAGGAAGPKL